MGAAAHKEKDRGKKEEKDATAGTIQAVYFELPQLYFHQKTPCLRFCSSFSQIPQG